MGFGTVTLRTLSVVGSAASMYWLIAFCWSAFVDPPPMIMIGLLVVATISGVSFAVVQRHPDVLVVATGSITVLRRLLVAGVLSYVVLAVLIYAAMGAITIASGRAFEGEAELGSAILALWVPIWVVPLSSSVIVWRWSRSASERVRQRDASQ